MLCSREGWGPQHVPQGCWGMLRARACSLLSAEARGSMGTPSPGLCPEPPLLPITQVPARKASSPRDAADSTRVQGKPCGRGHAGSFATHNLSCHACRVVTGGFFYYYYYFLLVLKKLKRKWNLQCLRRWSPHQHRCLRGTALAPSVDFRFQLGAGGRGSPPLLPATPSLT